jgi:predicted nucleotidyltransferase
MLIQREQIVDTIATATKPLPFINAMWLLGSAAFGRADEHSDVDVLMDVSPGRADDAFQAIEEAISSHLCPIERRWIHPLPTWHGHRSRFYKLQDAHEFLALDLTILEEGAEPRFNELERHGEPVVIFDKKGVVRSVPLDMDAHMQAVRKRVEQMQPRLPFLFPLVEKEIVRGDSPAAFTTYQRYLIDAIVELARIIHCPARYDYGMRYLHVDIPDELRREIDRLAYVSSLEDLSNKLPQVRALAESLLEEATRRWSRAATENE